MAFLLFNMKKYFIYLSIILQLFLSGVLFSQNQYLEDRLLLWLENNSREELLQRIQNLKRSSPDSPTPFYFEALLEEDANKATTVYKKIIQDFPNSTFAEYSILKLSQYYFISESYDVAR